MANRLRAGGSAFFGERGRPAAMSETKSISEEVVQEQGKRPARATRFITEEDKKADPEKVVETTSIGDGSDGSEGESEEEELEVNEEEGRTCVGQVGLGSAKRGRKPTRLRSSWKAFSGRRSRGA